MKNNAFECLEDFKHYIQKDLTQSCKEKYGKRVYGRYIKETLDNMLEAFEEQIEISSREVMRDDDLDYDRNFQGE